MPAWNEGSLHYYIHASLQSFIIYQPANKAASAKTYILPNNHLSYVPAWNDKNHHIFRNPWTSAFRWYTMDTSVRNSNLRKMRLRLHSLKPVNDTVNDTNALSVNHTQLNFTKSKSHSRIRAECILHLAICICVIDWVWFTLSDLHWCHWPNALVSLTIL